MAQTKSPNIYILGTTVKITSMLNVATATTATITIYNSAKTARVSSASMTKEADKIYSYIFQTTSTWDAGDYIAVITMVYGGYTSVTEHKFTMVEQEVE